MDHDAVIIEAVSGPTIEVVCEDLMRIYRAVFSLPPYNETEEDVQSFVERLQDSATDAGFRCVVARGATTGAMLGFGYGTPWLPAHDWHRCIAAACGASLTKEWLEPSFVLTELAVAPDAQRRGIGRRVHDALLASVPQTKAVLTTPQVEMPANQLYLSANWRVLRLDFQCEHMSQTYLVMGLNLSTAQPSVAAAAKAGGRPAISSR